MPQGVSRGEESPVGGGRTLLLVWTTTPPGYFFPERIAAGQVETDDLVFGFCIARTFQPELVFDSTLKAARYAQKRLGGMLMNHSGRPFAEDAARMEIRDLVEKLTCAGFEPGSSDTLYLI